MLMSVRVPTCVCLRTVCLCMTLPLPDTHLCRARLALVDSSHLRLSVCLSVCLFVCLRKS